ncbi:MAG TPA: DNA polymerase, partial [Micromonosporaceae bacterium]|nr:DNA polymerase [Micromonosporaceae bacterium]
ADDRPGATPDPAPAQVWSVRQVIGAQAFDPPYDQDQHIARAVLDRMVTGLRYARDAHTWLQRGPDRWYPRGDLSGWAVATVAELMPAGNPEAEKGSVERRRADRRKRLLSAAGGSAVATKVRALATDHDCAVDLAALDTAPDVLWAGGLPWDLRASADQPVTADLDPARPHLHTAGFTPDPHRPTPRWDAFLAAVWPDPGVRAWALRVLAIAVTGYPSAALPILLGPTRRGKSQVVTLLMSVLGSYAHAADPRLLHGTERAHASIVYELKGRRLSFIDEGPKRGFDAQERLKQLTGGTPLTGNRMREMPITFTPTHTLVLTANPEAEICLTDPAIRARVRLIPCEGDEDQVEAARTAIGDLDGPVWQAEAPGVLAAMMRQAAAWLAERASASTAAAPVAIRGRAEDLAEEQDPIRQWLTTETVPDQAGTKASTLYAAFVAWCRGMDIKAIPSQTRWGTTLSAAGHDRTRHEDGIYRPLRLRATGGWEPLLPAARLNGSGLGCTVAEPLPPQPYSGHNRSSEAVSGTPAEQLDSCSPITTTLTNNKDQIREKYIGRKGGEPLRVQEPPPETTSDLRKHGLGDRTADRAAVQPGEPAFVTARTATGRVSIDKKLTKARLQQIRIDEAAGEPVGLPALVERTGQPASIAPAAATSVLAAATKRSGALTVDVETTGYPVGHRHYALRTIQLGDAQAAVVLDATDPTQTQIASRALAAAPRLHAHSATADLVPLAHAGLVDPDTAWHKMHDTVIPAKLADPASTGSDPGLKQLAHAILGDYAVAPAADADRATLFKTGHWLTDTKMTTPVERSGWAQADMHRATMVRYGAADVLDTAALAQTLPPVDPALLHRERTAQHLTARVAHHGLHIDGTHVAELLAKHTALRAAAAERVRAFGIDNPSSDRQVAAVLTERGAALPRTPPSSRHPQGQPSVAEGALDPLLRTHPQGSPVHDLVRAVLDYRHHDTAITTFLEPYQQLVHHGDGRARPTVYTLAADTGRMSCVRPNLQQVPRQGGFRACITADPGHLLVSADFAGVELRVAAALSGDANLYRIITEGDADPKNDLHWRIAREVFGPEAVKADRYAAKRVVFGRLYGGGVPTLARQAGVTESVAASAVDVLDAMTPGLATWSHQLRQAVRAGRTQFPTYSGRIIHLPPNYPHKAANYAVQGTARELLVDALLRWADTRWGTAVLLPVHDEIVTVIPEADATDATAALVTAMQTELFGVQIKADPSTPTFTWADSA